MEDLDLLLELIDDKVVKTSEGLFIKVDDLKALNEQFQAMRQEEKEAKLPAPKSLAEARQRLMKDKDWMEGFQKAKKPATEGDLVKNVAEEEKENVA